MGVISIILRRPPYGSVDAAEAIRHTLGGLTNDMTVNLVLLDGGVNAARIRQDISGTAYLSAEGGIADCVEMGASVYADRISMAEERIADADLAEGVKKADSGEISDVLMESDTIMIF
jgi:sulfur relay (sulfurtransferase) DsrF/TusC family protein